MAVLALGAFSLPARATAPAVVTVSGVSTGSLVFSWAGNVNSFTTGLSTNNFTTIRATGTALGLNTTNYANSNPKPYYSTAPITADTTYYFRVRFSPGDAVWC